MPGFDDFVRAKIAQLTGGGGHASPAPVPQGPILGPAIPMAPTPFASEHSAPGPTMVFTPTIPLPRPTPVPAPAMNPAVTAMAAWGNPNDPTSAAAGRTQLEQARAGATQQNYQQQGTELVNRLSEVGGGGNGLIDLMAQTARIPYFDKAMSLLDWQRKHIGRNVGGELLYRMAQADKAIGSNDIMGGLPGPQQVLHGIVDFYGGPDAIIAAHDRGGDVGVWEDMLAGRADGWNPLLRGVYLGVLDIVGDPVNWETLGVGSVATKVGKGAEEASRAARVAREMQAQAEEAGNAADAAKYAKQAETLEAQAANTADKARNINYVAHPGDAVMDVGKKVIGFVDEKSGRVLNPFRENFIEGSNAAKIRENEARLGEAWDAGMRSAEMSPEARPTTSIEQVEVTGTKGGKSKKWQVKDENGDPIGAPVNTKADANKVAADYVNSKVTPFNRGVGIDVPEEQYVPTAEQDMYAKASAQEGGGTTTTQAPTATATLEPPASTVDSTVTPPETAADVIQQSQDQIAQARTAAPPDTKYTVTRGDQGHWLVVDDAGNEADGILYTEKPTAQSVAADLNAKAQADTLLPQRTDNYDFPTGETDFTSMEGRTREVTKTKADRNAAIKRGEISQYTPNPDGDRLVDRATYSDVARNSERRNRFWDEVSDKLRATAERIKGLTLRDDFPRRDWGELNKDAKTFEEVLSGAEDMVDTILPAYKKNFGDVDPIDQVPFAKDKAERAAAYRSREGTDKISINVEKAVYDLDDGRAAKAIKDLERLYGDEVWWPAYKKRIEDLRARMKEAIASPNPTPDEILLNQMDTTATQRGYQAPGRDIYGGSREEDFALQDEVANGPVQPPKQMSARELDDALTYNPESITGPVELRSLRTVPASDVEVYTEVGDFLIGDMKSGQRAVFRDRADGNLDIIQFINDGDMQMAIDGTRRMQDQLERVNGNVSPMSPETPPETPPIPEENADVLPPEAAPPEAPVSQELPPAATEEAAPASAEPTPPTATEPPPPDPVRTAIDDAYNNAEITQEQHEFYNLPVKVKGKETTVGELMYEIKSRRGINENSLDADIRAAHDEWTKAIKDDKPEWLQDVDYRLDKSRWGKTVQGIDNIQAFKRDALMFNPANIGGAVGDMTTDAFTRMLRGDWRGALEALNLRKKFQFYKMERAGSAEAKKIARDNIPEIRRVETGYGQQIPHQLEMQATGMTGEIKGVGQQGTAGQRLARKVTNNHGGRFTDVALAPLVGSSEFKAMRIGAGQQVRWGTYYLNFVRKQMPKAEAYFDKLLAAVAEKEGADPAEWKAAIQAAAKERFDNAPWGKRYNGEFTAEDIQKAIPTGQGQYLSRQWKHEVDNASKAAFAYQERDYFNYIHSTKADEVMKRTLLFHFWQTRQLKLYAEITMHNPFLLNATINMWNGMEKQAEKEGWPDYMKHMTRYMGETGAFYSTMDAMGALMPWSLFSDLGGDSFPGESFADKLVNKSPFMLAPYLQAAATATALLHGPSVDPLFAERPRKLFRTIVNWGAANGIDMLAPYAGHADPFSEAWRRLEQRSAKWVDHQLGRKYEGYNPATTEEKTIREVAYDLAHSDKFFGADESQWSDSDWKTYNAAISDEPGDNALRDAAEKEYWGAQAKGQLTGTVLPGGSQTKYAPAQQAGANAKAAYDTPAEDRTPAQQAAIDREEALKSGNPEFTITKQQYDALGTPDQQMLAKGWREIAYNDLPSGYVSVINGKTYTKADLARMDQKMRFTLADSWVESVGGTEMYKGLQNQQDAFATANPQIAEYKDFTKSMRDYPNGGAVGAAEYLAQYSPNFADYWNNSDKSEAAATSQNAFLAQRGDAVKLGDEPLDATDPTKVPAISFLPGSGGSGGDSKSTYDPVASLTKDLADYESGMVIADAYVNKLTGGQVQKLDDLDPQSQQMVENQLDAAGLMPSKPKSLEMYLFWRDTIAKDGEDTSPAAYIAWRDKYTASITDAAQVAEQVLGS